MKPLFLACLALLALSSQAPAAPPFKHVIIVFQENRTPDNLFGSNPTFEPGVDIASSGQNNLGETIPLTATGLAGCYDPAHGHSVFVAQYDNGKLDGGDQVKIDSHPGCQVPDHPVFKFADNSTGTIQPYFDIATQYGFSNRMFQTNQGASFPAHQFIFGGTSAPHEASTLFAAENMEIESTPTGCVAASNQRVKVIDATGSETTHPPIYPCFNRPTMADLLTKAHLSWKYYVDSTKTDGIWTAPTAIRRLCGAKAQGDGKVCKGVHFAADVVPSRAQVIKDIRGCVLPAVSWVIPDAAESDHAGANDGLGPDWVAGIVNLVMGQPKPCPNGDLYNQDTAIFITWDDWGGWFDHVPPYHLGGWGGSHNWGAGYIYGFRVPLLVVSAFTPPGYVDNTNVDFGSILKFIETNFGLGAIGPGYYADSYAGDLSGFFGLQKPRAFHTIAVKHDSDFFIHSPPSPLKVDDD